MPTVAVFGGSFSPVHEGHLEIALAVIRRGLADEVWLMPCRRNPLKDKPSLLPDQERLFLLYKAVSFANSVLRAERLKVCTRELDLPEPSYTSYTMKVLSAENPGINFRLIVGADSYVSFRRWKDWEWLEKNFRPIAYPRPGYETGEIRPPWILLEGVKMHDISSTQIRERLAQGERIEGILPWLSDNGPSTESDCR